MENVTREDVINAYRIYLGRDPESEKCFEGRVGLVDKEKLKSQFINSNEHRLKAEKTGVDFFIFGNCHALPYKNIIEAVTDLKGASFDVARFQHMISGEYYVADKITNAKFVVLATNDQSKIDLFLSLFNIPREKIRILPTFLLKSFHPDIIYIHKKSSGLISTEYSYNSRLSLFSYLLGIDPNLVEKLYSENVFRKLGYFDLLDFDRKNIASLSKNTKLNLSEIFECFLVKRKNFMHSINHPKIDFLKEVVFEFLTKQKIFFNRVKADYLQDPLELNMSISVYPEIAKKFSFDSDYYFKFSSSLQKKYGEKGTNLSGFIRLQYETFSKIDKSEIILDSYNQLLLEKFKEYLNDLNSSFVQNKGKIKNPYKNLPKYNFWRRSVSGLTLQEVDPVVNPKFIIKEDEKVATAGSCFAQHISKTLSKNGFNYFITEKSDAPDALANNYGVYSARYGNIYSTRQLLQLFYRVYGYFKPVDDAWETEDGRLVDPFRPQIQLNGFASLEELHESREQHFSAVRKMFEKMDIFVFTLGLTEIWRSKIDGAVFPLAPGVAGGSMDDMKYEFLNLSVEDVRKDLQVFLDMLSTVNPKVKVLLTVSPVSLMATYEDRHVLCSTTLSKSVLRSAADVIFKENSHVDYFPSYEIITGSYSCGKFYEEDFRSVRPEGVSQVMKIFMKNYTSNIIDGNIESIAKDHKDSINLILKNYEEDAKIICDEELLDQ